MNVASAVLCVTLDDTLCVPLDKLVLLAAALVVASDSATVLTGTYGVTDVVKSEDVEEVLRSDIVLVEEAREEREESEEPLKILNAGPLSGYAIPAYEHAASPAVGEDW